MTYTVKEKISRREWNARKAARKAERERAAREWREQAAPFNPYAALIVALDGMKKGERGE